MLLDMKSV